MFLALKEMKKYKLRYSLIGIVIVLIAYLIFVLTGLAYGLADSNRQAIDSWGPSQIVLNSDANNSLTQSTLSNQQKNKIKTKDGRADIAQVSANIQKNSGQDKTGTQMIGINPKQYIYKDLNIVKGQKAKNNNEAVVDQSLIQENHYKLGDKVNFGKNSPKFKIVGITKNAKLNVAPVVYTTTKSAQQVKYGKNSPNMISAVVLKHNLKQKQHISDAQALPINTFIQNIPGYSAQNSTFEMMIGFLLLITMFIIAIFLYILTMQKIPFFAVMKIQGISNGYLMKNIINQALLLTVGGVAISGILTVLTALALPPAVPMQFNYLLIGGAALVMIVMSIVGSIIPVRTVTKIDPATVIGG